MIQVAYRKPAQGMTHKPRSITLRPEQLATWGVKPGTRRHGVTLAVLS